MSDIHYDKVKDFILDLGYEITEEDLQDQTFIIRDEESGISNLVIGIAEPLLILEQYIMKVSDNLELFKGLLMKNRDIIHGAFALDDSGEKVLFRDTLQVDSLDINELEGSVNSLALLLSEYSDELLRYAKASANI